MRRKYNISASSYFMPFSSINRKILNHIRRVSGKTRHMVIIKGKESILIRTYLHIGTTTSHKPHKTHILQDTPYSEESHRKKGSKQKTGRRKKENKKDSKVRLHKSMIIRDNQQ